MQLALQRGRRRTALGRTPPLPRVHRSRPDSHPLLHAQAQRLDVLLFIHAPNLPMVNTYMTYSFETSEQCAAAQEREIQRTPKEATRPITYDPTTHFLRWE
jgi:hypothetical protein